MIWSRINNNNNNNNNNNPILFVYDNNNTKRPLSNKNVINKTTTVGERWKHLVILHLISHRFQLSIGYYSALKSNMWLKITSKNNDDISFSHKNRISKKFGVTSLFEGNLITITTNNYIIVTIITIYF